MNEDDILDRFECWELREKIEVLEGKLQLSQVRTPRNSTKVIAAEKRASEAESREMEAKIRYKDELKRSVEFEKKYEAALKRNVVLAKKVKDLGG